MSPFFVLSKGNEKNGPLGEAPRVSQAQDTQSFRRTRSMPNKSHNPGAQSFGDDSKKRKRSDQQNSGPAQEYLKRTKSAGGSSYFQAYRSGDREQLIEAENSRFEENQKFQETKGAERKKMKEKASKPQQPRQPQRTSSLPAPSTSPIPLINPRKASRPQQPRQPQRTSSLPAPSTSPIPLINPRTGRLFSAPLQQCSPITRNSLKPPPSKKPPLGGGPHLDQRSKSFSSRPSGR